MLGGEVGGWQTVGTQCGGRGVAAPEAQTEGLSAGCPDACTPHAVHAPLHAEPPFTCTNATAVGWLSGWVMQRAQTHHSPPHSNARQGRVMRCQDATSKPARPLPRPHPAAQRPAWHAPRR
eukprot:365185-Chlamydomonas_euryale.AAC.6